MTRKGVVWAGQAVLAVVLVVFVGRSLIHNWSAFPRGVRLDIHFGWIGLAAVTVVCTYALLIAAWRGILGGWGHALPYPTAARIWCVSNLGRYLPGKVWSLAGLTVLAKRAGASGGAAAGAALAMQALAVGTGAVVVGMGAPSATSGWALGLAIAVSAVAVGALAWRPVVKRVAALVRPAVELTPLPIGTVLAAAAVTLLSWVTYGVAFWLLGRGLLADAIPSVRSAAGIFAAGYVVGLLALFAPGGVGVRELVHVALLGPIIGNGGALALSIGSRLLLTATEAGAALVAVAVAR